MLLTRKIGVTAVILAATAAYAGVRVKINGVLDPTVYGSNQPISITVDGATSLINVYAEPAADADIGVLTLSGDPSQEIGIRIGDGAFPIDPRTPITTNAARNLGGVQVDPSSTLLLQTLRLAGAISGSLTGEISVGQVFRLQIDGDTQGTITANGSSPSSGEVMDHLVIGGTTNAPIIVTGGPSNNANLASLVAGSIQSSVSVPNGGITELRSFGPISIGAPGGITSNRGIVSLIAMAADNTTAQNISAAIDANYGNSAGDLGTLHKLIANTVSGSIATYNLADDAPAAGDGLSVRGDLDAPVAVVQDSNAPIDVRGSFTASASVQIGGNLRNDIVAHGHVTAIAVGADIVPSPTQHLIIKSETENIDLLSVTGIIGYCNMGCVPGVDVQIYAARTVRNIKVGGGPFDYSGFSVRNSLDPESGWVSIGKLIAAGNVALDARCGTFETIQIGGTIATTGDGSAEDPFEEVHFLTVPADHYFQIGGSLAENIFVDGAQAFFGGIIVNAGCANDDGPWSSGWDVSCRDDDNVLYPLVPPPDYTLPSGRFGGGAVGSIVHHTYPDGTSTLAGHLHPTDCDPPSQSSMCETSMPQRRWPGENSDRETAVLRHYVPVFNAGTGNVCRVYRFPNSFLCPCTQFPHGCEPCNIPWVEVTDMFQESVGPFGLDRELWVSPTSGVWDRSYNYKIELVSADNSGLITTQLRADRTFLGHEGDAPSIAGYPYYLYFPACFDMNVDLAVGPEDLMAWAAQPMDFDLDGVADEQDVVMLLDAIAGATPP